MSFGKASCRVRFIVELRSKRKFTILLCFQLTVTKRYARSPVAVQAFANGCEMYEGEDGSEIDYALWEVIAHEIAHIMENLIGNVSGKNYPQKENACNKRVNLIRKRQLKPLEKLKPEILPSTLSESEKRKIWGQSDPCP